MRNQDEVSRKGNVEVAVVGDIQHMASDQNSNSHNPTRLEGRVEASQRRDDALENVPDADAARHADKAQIDSAQKTNDSIWRSEGHFAITVNGETVARQKTAEADSVGLRSIIIRRYCRHREIIIPSIVFTTTTTHSLVLRSTCCAVEHKVVENWDDQIDPT